MLELVIPTEGPTQVEPLLMISIFSVSSDPGAFLIAQRYLSATSSAMWKYLESVVVHGVLGLGLGLGFPPT